MERNRYPTSEKATEPINTSDLFDKIRLKLAQAQFEDPHLGCWNAIRLVTDQDPGLGAVADQNLDLYTSVADRAARSLKGWAPN